MPTSRHDRLKMPLDRERLLQLLSLFGASSVGERANAAILADSMVRRAGLTWDDLLRGINKDAFLGDDDILKTLKEDVKRCRQEMSHLEGELQTARQEVLSQMELLERERKTAENERSAWDKERAALRQAGSPHPSGGADGKEREKDPFYADVTSRVLPKKDANAGSRVGRWTALLLILGGALFLFDNASRNSKTAAPRRDTPAALIGQGGADNSDQMYHDAMKKLQEGDYAGAGRTFKAFLQSHPQHALAGNAQYWLGESYYARKDYQNAMTAFAEGYNSYKTSPKGPDNLLKLGITLAVMGRKADACQVFAKFSQDYPRATDLQKRRIDQERQRNGCS